MNKNNVILEFSYANKEFDLNASDIRKVIRMSSKGFCIAVLSSENKMERLLQYSFNSDDLSFKDKIEAITIADQELNIDCKNSSLRLYTRLNVQIPDEFYEQKNDKTILTLLTENPQKYVPISEKIEIWNLYNLSAWKKDLHSEIKKKNPDYKLNTVLFSLFPIIARQKEDKKVLIFVGDNNFIILAVEKQKLLGVNTFSFMNENDFLYYSFAFLRKMYVNITEISIKLGGNIAPQSSLYTILNKYFSDVEMLSSTTDKVENYSYFCDLFE